MHHHTVFGFALLSLAALSSTAHAVLPTPADSEEISYTANPANTPKRIVVVAPQNIPIQNPLQSTTPAPSLAVQIPQSVPTLSPTLSQVASPVGQSGTGIHSVVHAFIVQNTSMQETLVPVSATTAIKSGDVLEYQGLFTNNSGQRVRSMDVTLGISDRLELIGGITPSIAWASVDNSRFGRMPIRANIGGQIQELPLSQYKALRWTVEELGLGGTAVVKYRAKVK